MESLKIKSAAKINITLDVLRRREDGFHDVKMIMQTVSLHDSIVLTAKKSGISVRTNLEFLPCGEENTAYKAAKLFFKRTCLNEGISIAITKRIPVAAGLAGGSGNAAAVLKGLNMMHGNRFTSEELADIAAEIGSDVPYCIYGGTMLAEGRGEILSRLPAMPQTIFLLAKPNISVSTKNVYRALNAAALTEHPDTAGCIKALENGDINAVAVRMYNVLETVTLKKYKIIGDIKSKIIECGALGSVMSGSGPTVIGMFGCETAARRAERELRKYTNEVYLTHTI